MPQERRIVSYSSSSRRHVDPLAPEPKDRKYHDSPSTSSQDLMPPRLREQAQHRAEHQRRHEQDTHTQHVRPVRVERDGDMVQQPDRDDEQEEDDGCDDQGHKGVDAPAREVAHFGVGRFRGGFLAGKERFSWDMNGRGVIWGGK